MDRGLVVRLVAQVCWFAFAYLALRLAVAAHVLEGAGGGTVTIPWTHVGASVVAFLGGLAATVVATRLDREKP